MKKENSTWSNWWQALLVVSLVWSGIFSVWFANNVYDKETFVTVVTDSLKSEEVKGAVAGDLVTKFESEYPLLGKVAGPTLDKVFQGVLGSNLLDKIYDRAATSAYRQLTTNEPAAVVINVKAATDFLMPVLVAVDPQVAQRAAALPDQIVLVAERQLPNISPVASFIVNFGRVLGLLGVGLLFYFVYKANQKPATARLFISLGLVTAVVSGLVYLFSQSASDYLLSQANSEAGRVLLEQLFKRFTVDLVNVSTSLFFGGLIIAVIASFWGRLKKSKS